MSNIKGWLVSIVKNRARQEKVKNKINNIDFTINNLKGEIQNLRSQTANLANQNKNLTDQNKNLTNQNNKFLGYLRKLTPQASIRQIDIHLAEHCNLHCFCCNHFSQLANEALPNIANYERDLKRLKDIGGGVDKFHLVGGEPLLNPNCIDFFKITRKYFPNSDIWLITNGILLPKQNEIFWQTCKEENIEIHPTKYPIDIDWNFVENKCKEYGIKLEFFNNAQIEKTSYQFLLDGDGKQDAFNSFMNCHQSNNCVQLVNGRMYTCAVAAYIKYFNTKFNETFPEGEENYIDIYKAKNFDEIAQFLAKPIPFCKYCKMAEWKSIGEWKRSSRTKDEYLIPKS